jgi:hypothetical protein
MTAVEKLELSLLGIISFDSEELRVKYKDIIAKAKEMEKQQQGYSEEDMIAFGEFIFKHTLLAHSKGVKNLFEQFKNK